VSKIITHLHIRAINACSSRGILTLGATGFPCRLGKTGRRFRKREGDGASPVGIFRLEQLYYRSDKMGRPRTRLKSHPLSKDDGWCDAPSHFAYNRLVQLPFSASHEALWRSDDAYDLVISTSHNERPRIRGFGSAIFLHVTNGAKGTEGCIALSEKHLRMVLGRCTKETRLVIWLNSQ
jgi:L,D-peptidoglycan transpeptidase YkuD (ErfK/YbiS/YcfS/YnhG family)